MHHFRHIKCGAKWMRRKSFIPKSRTPSAWRDASHLMCRKRSFMFCVRNMMILTQKRRSYIKRDLHIKRDRTTKFSIFHVESVWDTSLLGMRNEKRMFRKRYVCRKRCVAWQSDARAARHPRELLNVSKICRFPVFCWSLLVYVGLFCCINVCFEIPHFRHEKWRILSLCLFWCVKSLLMYERLFWVRIISFDVYRSLLLCKCLFWVRDIAFNIPHFRHTSHTRATPTNGWHI